MDHRKLTAMAAVIALVASFASCGKDSDVTVADEDIAVSAGVLEADGSESEESGTSQTSEEENDPDTSKSSDSKTSTANAESGGSTKTTAAAGKSGGNTSAGGGSSSGGGNTASGGSKSSGSSGSGGNSGTGGSSSHGGGSGSGAQTGTPVEEKSYTAEISFSGSVSASGDNVSVSGNVVTISAGGDYHISGSAADGQVYVSTATEEKVKIVLDGVDISCSNGPAILINEAKKCTIELADGSSNYLSDNGNDKINDGVIFSNDTLRIKGGGSLEITAGNKHGIASDDDIIIDSGTYTITSVKSGIFAHDAITINGGELRVYGGTNGIKSKGTVDINGGYTVVSGGTKEEKSSIYAGGAFNYTGGYVYAAGNMVTAPTKSANPYIVASFPASRPAGSTVELFLNGSQQVSFQPHNKYRCVIMLSPDISEGTTFTAYVDGSASADFTVSGTQNVFTID